jgi:hypothetical protein
VRSVGVLVFGGAERAGPCDSPYKGFAEMAARDAGQCGREDRAETCLGHFAGSTTGSGGEASSGVSAAGGDKSFPEGKAGAKIGRRP